MLYIEKTEEELEIERSRDGEEKSFEVGGLNTTKRTSITITVLSREKNDT